MANPNGDTPALLFDPTLASQSFDAQEALRAALRPEEVSDLNVDVEAAAVFVLGVAERLQTPDAQARFKRLHAQDFDPDALKRLGQSAWAAWHAHQEHQSASKRSQAVVPLETVQKGLEVRERMLKVIEHNTDEQEEVANIRVGSGHLDLARDLSACAGLYTNHADEIRHDRKHYRATDRADALTLASEILQAVARSRSQSETTWVEHKRRAFTRLARDYEEVAEGGRFLWRKERGGERFPKLVSVARAAPTRASKPDGKPVEDKPVEDRPADNTKPA